MISRRLFLGGLGASLTVRGRLAAELNVPILIHFQDVDNFQGEGAWAAGFATKFESVLGA